MRDKLLEHTPDGHLGKLFFVGCINILQPDNLQGCSKFVFGLFGVVLLGITVVGIKGKAEHKQKQGSE